MTDPRSAFPLAWSDWLPLADVHRGKQVPAVSGLYRVRAQGDPGLVYVGQSSNIKNRMGNLNSLYKPEMPYNDPHTAAPCLWVLRTEDAASFDVSFAEVEGDAPLRKACEAVVVSQYRREFGISPTANFGRMPDGWVKSTSNNRILKESGRRRRGYHDASVHRTSDHPCVLDELSTPDATDWCGLPWSQWSALPDAAVARGVYRIRRVGDERLLYIGQGLVRSRLSAHLAKATQTGQRQSALFSGDIEAGWVGFDESSLASQQLLEVENDLIASYVLRTGELPAAQFLG